MMVTVPVHVAAGWPVSFRMPIPFVVPAAIFSGLNRPFSSARQSKMRFIGVAAAPGVCVR